MDYASIIAGAGPAGLAAAEAIASKGLPTLVVEQNHEVGSPIRTSGGSFIAELDALGIPPHLYHPIARLRFISPNQEARFDYERPQGCIVDVRGVFQFLAERAIGAGAHLKLATTAVAPILRDGVVRGLRVRNGRGAESEMSCEAVLDATGYRSTLLKQAGLDPGFRRFAAGAEYDFFAPHCDQREALLLVGSQVAPSGYGWIFPWGRGRVRVGVGIIHPDSTANPEPHLEWLVENADRFGVNLRGAQPVEHHFGLIPSERFAERFAGDGILGVGDSAGHASALVGEGIRWAIEAGRMAGEVAAEAIGRGDVSRAALGAFDRKWRSRFGTDLAIAARINERIARWDDAKWDQRTQLLKLLSASEFAEALKTNLTGRWMPRFLLGNSRAIAKAGLRSTIAYLREQL